MARSIEARVAQAAEQALKDHGFVEPIEVLSGLGWLQRGPQDHWIQGRAACLEDVIQTDPAKVDAALQALSRWAGGRGLQPGETNYVARTRDRRTLRFSASGDPDLERAYRTHWVSPDMSPAKRARAEEQASRAPELVVISPLKDWTCAKCGGTGDFLMMQDDGPLCMRCAGLGHLVYLPAGDASVTRRAHKASSLSAVVVRFSRSRRRYERQGVLVEEQALADAEAFYRTEEMGTDGRLQEG